MKTIILVIAGGFWAVSAADQAEPKLPPELRPQVRVRDFDLRGDARSLFENVARAYGLDCAFDIDYDAGKTIRFQMQEADYRTALHALEAATGSFVVPVSAKWFLVVRDTPEKRNSMEPYVSMTVDIQQATTPQELTEVVTAVQQALALEKLGVQAQGGRVTFRGPISKLVPARELFETLMRYQPQVSVELKILEVSRNELLTYGVELPTMATIINVDTLNKVMTNLAMLGKAFSGTALGISITGARLLAQIESSTGKSLLHAELRSLNRQAVTFHAGDRYPVMTAQYVGASSTTTGITTVNTPGNGSTSPTPASFGSLPKPSALVLARLNRDNVTDVAATSADNDSAALLAGNGDGTYGDAIEFPAGKAPSAIAAADLDGDGRVDLVTANAESNDVSVLSGKGDGTFRDAVNFPVGTHPVAVAVADFNQDKLPDIVTANQDSNDLSILLGRADGTFAPASTVPAGSGPRALIAMDLNGDGIPDLAVVNSNSGDLSIFLGTGDGGFHTATTYTTGKAPVAVAAGDLNRDGRVDLVVANSSDGTVSVFAGDGTGAFSQGTAFAAGSGPVSLATGDFNLDGAVDVMVANPADGAISLLLGLGNLSLQAPVNFLTGAKPSAIAAQDLNGDGMLDIVTANSASNNFSLLLGVPGGGFKNSSGGQVPASGGQAYAPPPSFNFEDLGLVVKATPQVHGMDDVTLDIEAEVKLLTGQSVSGVPVISNRKLATRVRVPDGEWVMIAGLLSASEARTITGLPLINPIGKRTRDRGSSEVLILIKTNLLNLPPGEFVARPVALGSDTRPRAPL